jgi:hypothetical protein
MRRLTLAGAALTALVTAGIAVAHGIDGARSVTAVSGTFTATTVANSNTRTCTTSDGKTLTMTKATYTGTASGASDLTGPISIEARSVVDTTDGVGVLNGRLKIDTAAGDTVAQLSGVYDHGAVAGLAVGHGATRPSGLVGNVSASFSATGGFTSGKLGGGTAGGSAVELGAGDCKSSGTTHESSEAQGNVSAVSSASITVAGLTCTVPPPLAAKVSGLKLGDRAAIKCSFSNGTTTLVDVRSKH